MNLPLIDGEGNVVGVARIGNNRTLDAELNLSGSELAAAIDDPRQPMITATQLPPGVTLEIRTLPSSQEDLDAVDLLPIQGGGHHFAPGQDTYRITDRVDELREEVEFLRKQMFDAMGIPKGALDPKPADHPPVPFVEPPGKRRFLL